MNVRSLSALSFAAVAVIAVLVMGMLSGTTSARAWGLSGFPPVPPDAAAAPLARPMLAPAGEGGYAFMMSQDDGSAVKWDPCRPMHYVVNKGGVSEELDVLLFEAFSRISNVTGQVVFYDGETNELPSSDREATDYDRYGDQWAPVLIAWTTPEVASGLEGDVAGYAGPMAVRDSKDQPLRYISGQVVLDAPQLTRIFNGPDGRARARAVLLHELAHLFGLEHVGDNGTLMYPSTSRTVLDFTPSDLRGLAAVSGGQCFTGGK